VTRTSVTTGQSHLHHPPLPLSGTADRHLLIGSRATQQAVVPAPMWCLPAGAGVGESASTTFAAERFSTPDVCELTCTRQLVEPSISGRTRAHHSLVWLDHRHEVVGVTEESTSVDLGADGGVEDGVATGDFAVAPYALKWAVFGDTKPRSHPHGGQGRSRSGLPNT
jgi:hypothetical protein